MTANRGPALLQLLRGGLGNATPDAITPGSAGEPGVATLGSRQDHDHPAPSFPVLDAVDPAAIISGQGAAPGVAATASHRDHQHATPELTALGVATPEAIVSGQAGAAGGSAAASHQDHVHATPALLALDAVDPAAIVSGQAAAPGVAATGSHRDHVHATPALSSLALGVATPEAIVSGQAGAAGNAVTASHENHVHATPALLAIDDTTPAAVTPGSAGAAGVATTAPHRDHEHPATNVPTVASVAAAAAAKPLNESVEKYFQNNTHKQFCMLGGVSAVYAALATGSPIGMGFSTRLTGSGFLSPDSSGTNAIHGAWLHGTNTSSASESGFVGPTYEAIADPTLYWRGVLTTAASQTQIVGFNPNTFSDGNDMVAFRVSNTGTIVGVCDTAGVETTRDSGLTPDGATEYRLRIEIRSGGTIVRFYLNDVQVGADVTTNIPGGSTLFASAGIINSTTAHKQMFTYDLACWREVGNS